MSPGLEKASGVVFVYLPWVTTLRRGAALIPVHQRGVVALGESLRPIAAERPH